MACPYLLTSTSNELLESEISVPIILCRLCVHRPKEQLSSKPYKKTYAAVSVVDLYESKEGRKLEINFLGSPIKESWPKEESPGPLFADDSDVHADDSLSNSTIKSRRKAKIFVTDQGSVTSQKFITQRSHQLADGLHTTDISSARLSKYFGDESKAKFYDTYRELKRQKLLLPIKKNSKGFVEPDLDVLISASVDDHPVNKSIADLVGLGVIRPSTEGGRKKGRQDDDSGTEIYNVHSFEESVCSARDGGDSVTSSITDRPRRAIAQSVPIDSDDESLFSDADMDAVQTPVKPLFPFVSIFSNEKISDRRISRVLEGADVAKLSIDYEENARKPLSAPKDGEMLVQRNSLGSLSNNYSGMPESPRQRDKPSMVTQNTKLGNAVGPKRKESKVAIDKPTLPNRRSSASAASSAKPKKDEMRKQVSCMGKLDVTKKPVLKSNTKDSLVGEPSPYLVISPVNATLKRLNSGNEFASFASTNSFEATNLRASSIEEHSGFQESAAGGLRLSRALREDVESDDEDIIFGGDNEGYLSYGCNSPRAKFLAGCIDKKIPPRNALMLRSKVSSVLFLEHHGMGDDLALLLAPALVAMPLVSGVNIADNNLSDIGLEAIISSIAKCEHVRDVDISQNTIGPKAAAALARLLGNKECKLSKITMKKANIDDGECERFVEALKDNRYLQELDMSDNLLGKDENLNAVKPDIVTAGEALASLLREGQCPLTTLKIAWNMIRMEGAYELCTALEACRTLEHIDLSFNALGRESGIALGSSIELMPRLKELLLSNNGLDPMAAFTLCVGARECPSMTYLCLDNNPVGDLGMRAILTNVVYCGSRLTISARGCDFILVMPNCHYRRADPVGCYDITLSNGFDRAILLGWYLQNAHPSLIDLKRFFADAMDAVAMHQSLFIEDFQYSYEQNDLDQTLTKFNEKKLADAFDRHENKEIDSLNRMHRILSNDNVKKKMIQVFNERQHEGSIDKTVMGLYRDEAVDIIEGIGRVEYSESQFRTLFAYYDVCDDSTIITSFIFIQMIDKIESEALLRIRDATHLPRFSVNGGKTRYVPPQVGRIRMKVVDNFVNRPDGYGLTNYQTQMMHHMSQNHADVSIGLGAVMELFKVRCEEATSIFHILMESTADPANALATILPCLTTSPDIRAITNMYGRNPTTQRRLEQRMGNAYKAYVGPVDGFYHIDLRVSTDRLCLKKLMQISASNSQLRKMKNLGDISQYGDWSSFRNKHFVHPISDGAGERQSEIRLTNEGLTPMPTSGLRACSLHFSTKFIRFVLPGIIEFDFSGAPRGYVKKAEVISNEWFLSALIQTGLTTEESRPNDIQWLQDVELRQRKNSTGAGQSLWQRDLGRAAHISAYLHEKIFNPSQLNKRHSRIIESLAKERMLQSELTAKAKAEADAIASKKRMEELEKKRNYGRARSSNLLSRPPSR